MERETERVNRVEIHQTFPELVNIQEDASEVYLVKLPNFLNMQPKPFDPETFESETTDTSEGARLKVENTIR